MKIYLLKFDDVLIKLIRKMKLTILLMTLLVSGVFATNAVSQVSKVTLAMNNVTVAQVMDAIEDQTDYLFVYNKREVDLKRKVTVVAENKTVAEVLSSLFYDTNIIYAVEGPNIMLMETTQPVQQHRKIAGKITDINNQPLPGVTIIIKGTTQGTVSNTDGEYSLTNVPDNATLVFSFVGMETKEIPVGNQTTIDVMLESATIGIEEVVAVGYGTMRKSDLTGTVSRVTTERAMDIPNSNILQALKGNVAGLNVGTPDRPGENPSLSIRGTNSISAGNSPLIVVDGIIYNGSLSSINTNDVESVDVLKDASAAAVYGSRSANGVIIITTKKGTSEKPVFNFSGKYGISNPVKLIEMLDGPEYIQKVIDFWQAKGQDANINNVTDYLNIVEANNYEAGKTIDWYDELVKPANFQNYNLSVSGKTENTNYFISGAYHGEEGIVENDNFKRITARANFINQITDWFTVTVKSSFSNLDYSGVQVPLISGLSPYSSFYEDKEKGTFKEYPMDDTFFLHPFIEASIDNSDVRNDLWGLLSGEINIPFIQGLKWTMNYSLNHRLRKLNEFQDKSYAKTSNGSARKEVYENYDWLLDNILNYKRSVGDHFIDLTFLYSREYQRYTETMARASNFFNQAMGYHNLGIGGVQTVSSNFGDQNGVSYMGRLNYIFKERYAATATIRRDGFSGFAEGHKYGTFRSAALAWTASNEKFMSNSSLLSLLKLRLSYGENGNQAIGRYATLARMGSIDAVFGESTHTGLYVSSMANTDLGWETTKVFNTGVDLGFFKNRLNATADVYFSKTYDLLLQRNIPNLTGFNSIWTNIGEVSNRGVELTINSINIQKNNIRWETGFAFDLNRNRIEKLYGEDLDGDGKEDDDISNNWFIGQPLGVFFGYNIDGIYQLDDTDIPEGYRPGDFRIVDKTGEGEITQEDRYIYGNRLPNFKFSISNNLIYKNFSLYVMINSIQGGGKNNYYMGNNMMMHNPNNQFATWSERFNIPKMDYWTPNNPSNTAARIDYIAPREHNYLENRSFVRIQDVNLAYSFNRKFLTSAGLEDLRIFVSGKNLYTFTKWSGYDPENATTWRGNRNNDGFPFPMLRTFTLGVDMKF
jgi:TonB-linked SusC/RagA family outer membrane protein